MNSNQNYPNQSSNQSPIQSPIQSSNQSPNQLRFMYWPLKISQWADTSILPLGELEAEAIGEAGDAAAEIKKALEECELIDHEDEFTQEM